MAAKKKAKREEKVAEDTFYVRVLDAELEITGSDLIPDGATIREMAVASMGLPRHEDPPESDDTLHCCGRSPAECEASPGPRCAGTVMAGLTAPDRTARLVAAAKALAEGFESVVAESSRTPGGMSVPFCGDFAVAVQLPSLVLQMRWWANELRAALKELEP